MVFPHNIDKVVKESSKANGKDKMVFTVSVAVVADIYLYATMAPKLKVAYGIPMILSFLILFNINAILGITMFRVFVVKEKDQLKEFENSKADSLSRYYFIRERENPKIIDGIEIFENVDGNFFFCLQIFYGPNDLDKSNGTLRYYSTLFNMLSRYCIDFRPYVCREQFRESIECKRFLNGLGKTDNQNLTRAMLEVSDMLLDFTDKNGQLYSTYIIGRMTPFQLDSIKALRTELDTLLHTDLHSIRNYSFLDKKRFRDFIRDYCNVEALDLSNIRNPQASAQLMRTYGKHIHVCKKDDYGYTFNTGVKQK